MTGDLPSPQEADQLLRLRSLRATRSRERFASAMKDQAGAEEAVRRRQQSIRESRGAVDSFAHAVVGSLAPHLPRWNGVMGAVRARLGEQLEREEDAMLGDARRLNETREAADRARSELSRAIAREDVVRDLARQARRARAVAADGRVELEIEDQVRGATPGDGALR
jgi:hypothetical protein